MERVIESNGTCERVMERVIDSKGTGERVMERVIDSNGTGESLCYSNYTSTLTPALQ